MTCYRCGSTIEPGSRFCSNCAAALSSAPKQQQKSNAGKWIIGILVVLFLWSIVFSTMNKAPKPQSAKAPAAASAVSPKPSESTQPITAAEKLAEARKIMETYTAWRNLLPAKEHLSDIPSTAPEYPEARRLLSQLEPRLRKAEAQETAELRPRLAESFSQTIADANKHLNFISSKTTKVKGGYAIWAVHEFFSQYTLSVGNDAKIASAWISSNQTDLETTHIVQVGFWGSGAFGSRCWLTVP
jgi:predicted nucleic acid-binding Zn ribbon protein